MAEQSARLNGLTIALNQRIDCAHQVIESFNLQEYSLATLRDNDTGCTEPLGQSDLGGWVVADGNLDGCGLVGHVDPSSGRVGVPVRTPEVRG
ncbi:hypothetical protein [Rhodococcus wratislaviensis]|uniref:hypothetical protein n=1 Tax=Rhodococcus wratislaviensis TaxID=44752 RepID=UPI0036633CEF